MWFKKKRIGINQQLKNLHSVGIRLKKEFDLMKYLDFEHEEYLEKPYICLMMSLGSETEIKDNEFGYLSNDVWYFDMECVEDHGDYVRLLARIKEMINGEVAIEEIKDCIDFEEERISITFSVNGHSNTYELELNDDWIDVGLFGIFSNILMEIGSKKRFFYSALDQCLLVVLIDKEQYVNLNSLLNVFIPANLEEGRPII